LLYIIGAHLFTGASITITFILTHKISWCIENGEISHFYN
jgi:hypothetical protein